VQGRRKQCKAAGASHFKRALHFSERQYLFKTLLNGYSLLVAIMGRRTSTLILNNFICWCKIKSVNGRILLDLALILLQLVKNKAKIA
jgi:hypothetical protein